ncbi:amino acid ABC transporter, permease protein, partial [Pseudomonas fluorescens]
ELSVELCRRVARFRHLAGRSRSGPATGAGVDRHRLRDRPADGVCLAVEASRVAGAGLGVRHGGAQYADSGVDPVDLLCPAKPRHPAGQDSLVHHHAVVVRRRVSDRSVSWRLAEHSQRPARSRAGDRAGRVAGQGLRHRAGDAAQRLAGAVEQLHFAVQGHFAGGCDCGARADLLRAQDQRRKLPGDRNLAGDHGAVCRGLLPHCHAAALSRAASGDPPI